MTYSIKNSRNVEVTTVANNILKVTNFGIRIPGRNYAGYGEAIGQSLLHILENFACPDDGSNQPDPVNPAVSLTSPVEGQLWYDTTARKLKVWEPNDAIWKIVSGAAQVGTVAPSGPSEGDLWWNQNTDQVFGYDGAAWILIGPVNTAADINRVASIKVHTGGSGGLSSGDGVAPTGGTATNALGTFVGNVLISVHSNTAVAAPSYYYIPLNDDSGDVRYYSFDPHSTGGIFKGVNIGENSSDYWFQGKAREAASADAIAGLASTVFIRNDAGAGADTSRLPVSNNTLSIGSSSFRWATIYATTFNGTATAAQYSDLAERYETDMPLSPGDVVTFGGEKEITLTVVENDENVFGVVSTQPGFLLNETAGGNDTHPHIALTGRVPCKVVGQVAKGGRLVSSNIPGVARAMTGEDGMFGIIGRAIQEKTTEEVALHEIVVGVK